MRVWNCRQVLDQFAEIDAFLGQEVKDDALAAQQVLDVNEFHLQVAAGDKVAAGIHLAALGLAQLQGGSVLVGQAADNAAMRRLGEQGSGSLAGLAEHVAGLQPAVAADDDAVAAAKGEVAFRLESAEEAHGAVANDLCGRHDAIVLSIRGRSWCDAVLL